MSRTRRNEVLVGLFVMASFGVLFGMTALIRGTTGINPWELQTRLRNVVGLEIGSAVLVSGFRLGRVTEMYPTTMEDGEPGVIVEMKVSRTIPIHENAVAKLAQQGFVGDMRIEIYPGTEDFPTVDDGFVLQSQPATDITAAFSSAQEIVEDAHLTIIAVKELLSDPERISKIDKTLENIAQATDNVNKIVVENQKSLTTSLENIQQVSGESKEIVAQVRDLLLKVDARFESLGSQAEGAISDVRGEVKQLSARADQLLANADKAATSADELVVDARSELAALTKQFNETADKINALLDDIREGDGTISRLLNDAAIHEDVSGALTAISGFLGRDPSRPYNLTIDYEPTERTAAP